MKASAWRTPTVSREESELRAVCKADKPAVHHSEPAPMQAVYESCCALTSGCSIPDIEEMACCRQLDLEQGSDLMLLDLLSLKQLPGLCSTE